MTLEPGTRVVVAAGPWPERRGAHGVIVDGPEIYPFHGVARHECVILLDDDPLTTWVGGPHWSTPWSCVCCRRDLVPEP